MLSLTAKGLKFEPPTQVVPGSLAVGFSPQFCRILLERKKKSPLYPNRTCVHSKTIVFHREHFPSLALEAAVTVASLEISTRVLFWQSAASYLLTPDQILSPDNLFRLGILNLFLSYGPL